MSQKPNLQLYAWDAANGHKVVPYLGVLELDYEIIPINISKNEQKQPDYLGLNPNGRIPTLVDQLHNGKVSQSAAVLLYLAEKYDPERKWSYDAKSEFYWLSLEVLLFVALELSPIQGNFYHFLFVAPKESNAYGIKRYGDDTQRIYGVLEEYLKRNEPNGNSFVGPHYAPVDFAAYGFLRSALKLPFGLSKWPRLKRWYDEFTRIPGVAESSERLIEVSDAARKRSE